MKIALIHNPGSGSAGDTDIEGRLREAGAEVESFEISSADLAAEIAGSGVDRVAVAGGDGSIALAASIAIDNEVPLAVIAAGTANDFAARLELPPDPVAGADLAATGERTRPVDLGRVGSRSFVNVASLGLPPVAAELADDLKQRLGALAYTVGALRAGGSGQAIEVEVSCDGSELFNGDAWQVTIGCTGAFGGGSGIDAEIDDRLLDAVVIEGANRLRLAKHAIGLKTGTVEDQQGVHSSRCSSIEVRTSSPELNVDGELVDGSELEEDGALRFGIAGRFQLVIA